MPEAANLGEDILVNPGHYEDAPAKDHTDIFHGHNKISNNPKHIF